MNLWTKGLRRSRARALEQFARFLALHRERYSKLVASGPSAFEELGFTDDDHQRLADACRRWLPHLTDSIDRDLCRGIIELHESPGTHDDALELLHVALLAERERDRSEATSTYIVNVAAPRPYTQPSSSHAA